MVMLTYVWNLLLLGKNKRRQYGCGKLMFLGMVMSNGLIALKEVPRK